MVLNFGASLLEDDGNVYAIGTTSHFIGGIIAPAATGLFPQLFGIPLMVIVALLAVALLRKSKASPKGKQI